MIPLPSPKAVRDLLADLLGRSVDVTPGDPVTLGPSTSASVAVYVDDALRTAALLLADLPLSAYLGAAIGLVPPAGAAAAIEDQVLSPALLDNVAEVYNIAAGLFNGPDRSHVRLYATYEPGELPPSDVVALAGRLGSRLDQTVAVDGYGSGRLSVVIAD